MTFNTCRLENSIRTFKIVRSRARRLFIKPRARAAPLLLLLKTRNYKSPPLPPLDRGSLAEKKRRESAGVYIVIHTPRCKRLVVSPALPRPLPAARTTKINMYGGGGGGGGVGCSHFSLIEEAQVHRGRKRARY